MTEDAAELKDVPMTKACRVCSEEIKRSARKCIHCDSWQDWRGELGTVGPAGLSMVGALISIGLALTPIISAELKRDDSIISWSYQSSNSIYTTLLVSNSGRRPGSVSGGWVQIPRYDSVGEQYVPGGAYRIYFSVITQDQAGAALIEPGASSLVRLKAKSLSMGGLREVQRPINAPLSQNSFDDLEKYKLFSEATQTRGIAMCTLSLTISNFGGYIQDVRDDLPCQNLDEFIDALKPTSNTQG